MTRVTSVHITEVKVALGEFVVGVDRVATWCATTICDAFPAFLLCLHRSFLGNKGFQTCQTPGIELASIDSGAHRTPRLTIMFAVSEPAMVHEIEHVGKGLLDSTARQPQTDRPEPRGVDQPPSTINRQQPRRHSGMPPALIGLPVTQATPLMSVVFMRLY